MPIETKKHPEKHYLFSVSCFLREPNEVHKHAMVHHQFMANRTAARKSIQLKWQEKNIASQAHLLALGVQQRKEDGVAGVVGA